MKSLKGNIAIVAGIAAIFFFIKYEPLARRDSPADFAHMTYVVEGGTARYFGNAAEGDVNGDGLVDTAFLVVNDSAGTGVFYYAIVALGTADGYRLTNPFFVGDRIAPQSTEIHTDSWELRVNYAMRKEGEPMTAQPSQGATLFLKVSANGVLEGLMR